MRTAVAAMPFLALTACSAGDDGATTLPPGSGAATATTTTAATGSARPADQVRAAYLRYWDAVLAAHRAADPRSPALARVAADPLLSEVRAAIDRNRTQKLSLRGAVTHEPAAVRVAGGTATLEDCYDISGWDPVDLATGDPVEVTEEGGTGRYRARFTLRRSATGWVVTADAQLGGC